MEEGSSIIGRGNSLDYSKVGEYLHNYIWQKKSFFSVIFDGSMFSMEPNVIKFCLNLQWYWRRRLSSSARDPCIGFHQKTVFFSSGWKVTFLQVEKFLFSKLKSIFSSSLKVFSLQVEKFFLQVEMLKSTNASFRNFHSTQIPKTSELTMQHILH